MKTISRYDESGNLIDSFNGVREAAKACGGRMPLIISAYTRHRKYKGYHWRYTTETPPNHITLSMPQHGTSVVSYDRSGNMVKRYPSMSAANADIGVKNGVINAINDPYRRSGGLYWRKDDGNPPSRIEIVSSPQKVKKELKKIERQREIESLAKKRVIFEYNLKGEPTGVTYKNATAAATELGVTRQMVSFHIRNPDLSKTIAGKVLRRRKEGS